MTLRFRLLVALAALALIYGAYPYVALYRLGAAIGAGDTATLAVLIDWDAVREGIKEDIADAVMELPAPLAEDSTQLPPFGYSFVRGVTANAVDANVTPEVLLSVARGTGSSPPSAMDDMALLHWAFFAAPTRFRVALRLTSIAPDEPDIRLRMELRHGGWRVTRVRLPPNLLRAVNARS
jgi:hypothetical protein